MAAEADSAAEADGASGNEPGWTRTDVEFWSGPDRCRAWLYLPDAMSTQDPGPVVVMAHGFAAVKWMCLDDYAARFAAAGYGCLVFDYRFFGDSDGTPRELIDIDAQLDDWRAAVAFARSLPVVDPDRVALWGTSFAGGHVIVTAANDHRIAAVISQCPFTDGVTSAKSADRSGALALTKRIVADLRAARTGGEPVRVPVAGAPGDVALMTSHDALSGYRSIVEAGGGVHRNLVPARIAAAVVRYRPGRRAKDVTCPILFFVCEGDSLAPPDAAIRYAGQAQRGLVVRYPGGHFDIYTGDGFERTVESQVRFLEANVEPAPV